jgi:hypothetical protein
LESNREKPAIIQLKRSGNGGRRCGPPFTLIVALVPWGSYFRHSNHNSRDLSDEMSGTISIFNLIGVFRPLTFVTAAYFFDLNVHSPAMEFTMTGNFSGVMSTTADSPARNTPRTFSSSPPRALMTIVVWHRPNGI